MSFDEIRLADWVERGAKGGPSFNTTIFTLNSGDEKRNQNWAKARLSWDIGFGMAYLHELDHPEAEALLEDVLTFFYGRQGKARGFRFKDWSDYRINPAQAIGIGTGSNPTFQIFKRYTSGGVDYDRKILKPVEGTVLVYLNSVLKTETTDYTVDYTTGIITFGVNPGVGVVVSVGCEFDVPVRFDTDKLDITLETFEAGQISSIPLIELKNAA